MKFLLDTNILSEPVKTIPDKSVLEKLKKYQYEITTAAPVWHELQFGCRRLPESKKREIITQFLNEVIRPNLIILPYDDRAAEWHAEERARLSIKGQTPAFVDGQIASIAKVNGLILVTRNTEDFKPFAGLKIRNWYA